MNDKVSLATLALAKAYTDEHGGGGGGTSNYNDLTHKPTVNGIEFKGTLTGETIGLVDAEDGKSLSTNDYTDADKAIVDGVTTALAGKVSKSETAGLLKNDGTVDTTTTSAVSANTSAITAIKDGTDIDSFGDVETALANKVDKVSGKGLSENDYTDADKTIVDGVTTALAGKVDKVTGKGLSTNDYTNEDKAIVTTAQDNIKANTKLIKDTVGWSGKNVLLYPYYQTTRTESGITFTDNGDGTVTVNGTATANVFYQLLYNDDKCPFNSDYIMNGCPSGGDPNKYSLEYRIGKKSDDSYVDSVSDYGSGVNLKPYDPTTQHIRVYIRINNGQVCNNLVFKPMIRSADILDPTYEPYFGSTAFPRSEQAVLGAKNIWKKFSNNSYEHNGVIYTQDDDGVITLNGTPTATSWWRENVTIKAGTYTISDGLALENALFVGYYNSSSSLYDISTRLDHNKTTVTFSQDVTLGQTVRVGDSRVGVQLNNLKVYPMLRLASDSDDTFVAPAMTNRELTDKVNEITTKLLPNNADLNNYLSEGNYIADASVNTYTNIPPVGTTSFRFKVLPFNASASRCVQIVIVNKTEPEVYMRTNNGGTWQSWYKFTGTVVS